MSRWQETRRSETNGAQILNREHFRREGKAEGNWDEAKREWGGVRVCGRLWQCFSFTSPSLFSIRVTRSFGGTGWDHRHVSTWSVCVSDYRFSLVVLSVSLPVCLSSTLAICPLTVSHRDQFRKAELSLPLLCRVNVSQWRNKRTLFRFFFLSAHIFKYKLPMSDLKKVNI